MAKKKVKAFRDLPVPKKIARWQALYDCLGRLTKHERTEHFDMSLWGVKTACGTVACAAGHGAFDPTLRRMGFRGSWKEYRDSITITFSVEPDDFFGDVGVEEIFCGPYDTVGEVRHEIKKFIRDLEKCKTTGDERSDQQKENDESIPSTEVIG